MFEGTIMKKIRNHLIIPGTCLIIILSGYLAYAQAPAAALPKAAAPAPGAAAPAETSASAASRLRAMSASRLTGGSRTPVAGAGRTLRPASRNLAAEAASSIIKPSAGSEGTGQSPALKFDNTPVDIVLMAYAEQTGKTLLMAPDVPKANITLKSQPSVQLTSDEFVEAIEVVLSMNGIVLEPFGENFLKVLARKTIRTDGTEIIMVPPEGGHQEKTRVVSQMFQLQHITIDEAKKAIEGFKKPDGMIQSFERTNSLLVTDIQENINRMLEIIKFIDQPIPVTEEVFSRTINFAKADDIKKRIEELVAESQSAQGKTEIKSKSSGSPGMSRTTSSSIASRLSRLRSSKTKTPVVTPSVAIDAMISDADRGMIRGKVQVISDERTNQLIIITRKENMDFFDSIISVLDVETTPDVKVEVLRLEYADAEEISTMLNELIGNASTKKADSSVASKSGSRTSSKTTTLAAAAAARARGAASSTGAVGKSKLGQLSKDNIKILADKRTNAVVMMGSIGDLAAIIEIIKSMDVMLSQVLIETVVVEVMLKDEIETGINWVRRINNSDTMRYTVGGGNSTAQGVNNLFSSQDVTETVTGVDADGEATSEDVTTTVDNMAGEYLEAMSNPVSGLEYFMTLKNLRLDAVIVAAKNDSRSRVMSSPVLLTVDNKEASIEATETKYMYKGMRYMGYSGSTGGGSYEPDIEQRDVGLTVKVTPRISPNGNVILTVEETFEDVLGSQVISGESWPTVTSRKLSADVSVGNGETVILGGLVKTLKSDSESGIPILKDIPYIGKYLFGSTKKTEDRSEMLVFLTPYVIDNDEDMREEARRRKDYVDASDVWTKGWSNSDLADPVSEKEMKIRLERKKILEKRWTDYGTALEEHNEIEAKIRTEKQKALNVLNGLSAETNGVPPSAGLMKVDLSETVSDEAANPDAEPLLEDASLEPQRPETEPEKRSWWKRLFSS